MNEEVAARAEVARLVGTEVVDRIERFIVLLAAESQTQNLVSKASVLHIWARHILDSLQLVAYSRPHDTTWADIGTGAGFPGLVVAMLGRFDVVLIEPRRRRAEFLQACIDGLDLQNVSVAATNAQGVASASVDIISARAVAATTELLAMSVHLAKPSTRFIFPKGEGAAADVETARHDWHGMFHVEQSCTSPTSGIVVIDQVRAR